MFVKIKSDLSVNINTIKYFYEVREQNKNKIFYYIKLYFLDKDSMIVYYDDEEQLNKICNILNGKDK